jgi:hypothetical protein
MELELTLIIGKFIGGWTVHWLYIENGGDNEYSYGELMIHD